MAKPSSNRASTRVSRIVKAEREAVYHAFLDPASVALWFAPDKMKGRVHAFDVRVGGTFRMSLTYQDQAHPVSGKTSEDTDTFQGRFVELRPYERIVEAVLFESLDPAFRGKMKMIVNLAEAEGGTEVTVTCEDIPTGIKPEDNEQGCKESLQKLAKLLEE